MPVLAGVIKAIFVALVGLVSTVVSKRFAIAAAVAAVFLSSTSALLLSLMAVVSGLAPVMPAFLARAVCWFWPESGNAIIAAVLGAYVTRFVYDVGMRQMQLAWKF